MCAMCGKEGRLVNAIVEGSELQVCSACSKYGKVLKPVIPPKTPKQLRKIQKKIDDEPVLVDMIVDNYSSVIRNKREQMGLKQSEFAKMVNEKESVIQHIETGKFTPSFPLARKFEKILKVTLVEKYEDKTPKVVRSEDEDLTLGDMIKFKKR